MSGGLEAYKMPILLFQVMMCICSSDDVVPDSNNWLPKFTASNLVCNPKEVIVKAAAMVLEVVLFLNVESMNTLNLDKLDTFIKSTLVHVNKLYELKNALTGVNNFFGGLKLHALLHWTSQIKNFGMSFSFDTTSMEEAMKVNAIQNYGNTSRRSKTFIIEMTRNLLRRNICNHFKSST